MVMSPRVTGIHLLREKVIVQNVTDLKSSDHFGGAIGERQASYAVCGGAVEGDAQNYLGRFGVSIRRNPACRKATLSLTRVGMLNFMK